MSVDELTDEEALQNFLLDIDCLDELNIWTEKFNLFDILKISRAEIRHSNMLAWLFDANENHGVGDKFFKKIMQKLVERNSKGKFDIFQILLFDFYSFIIYREWKNIDLLFVSDDEKTVIVIENKVGSNEHSNQLNRYRESIEDTYPGYEKIYIYLSPNGLNPSDTDNWVILTYLDIVDVLSNIMENTDLLPDVYLIINNYIEVLRRDIVDDTQLFEICNKIYNKHKKALDLIYENRVNNDDLIKNILSETLYKLDDWNRIFYDGNTSLRFNTHEMSDYLPLLELSNSTWNNKYPYSYWIQRNDNIITIFFELGGENVPESTLKRMQPIIDYLKPNDKRRKIFKYKRLQKFVFNIDFENQSRRDIENQLISAIEDVLYWERNLLEKIKNNNE